MRIALSALVLTVALTSSAVALAEEAEAAPAAEATPAGATADADGARFRFGVAGGAGLMFWDGPNLTYGGVDLRFGVQVNDQIGVYAQPQLGYYSGDFNGTTGGGGLIGTSAVVDYTFADQLFLGGGLGYAVLNNPSGLELHFRAGGYPLMGGGKEEARRKGLMLGADLRLHFVEGLTFVAPTLVIGYEAY